MRKTITLSLLALTFSLFSGQLLAGKIEACELIKKDPAYKGLYGLCNAYWNAGNENARAQILANFEEKAGPGGPGMPGLEPEGPGDPEEGVCPCWDIHLIEQAIACDSYAFGFSGQDLTSDNSGFDLVLFDGPASSMQLYAGNTPFNPVADSNECLIIAPSELVVETFAPVSGLDEDACRLDILDLIASPPSAADCETQP